MSLDEAVERHYERLERRWKIVDRISDYQHLVVPTGNSNEPFHRWFHLKEAFSSRLLTQVLTDLSLSLKDELSILDCFSGSGTTVVSACQLSARGSKVVAHAIEHNPFLFLVSSVKARSCLADETVAKELDEFSAEFDSLAHISESINLPGLSTFSRDRYFEPLDLQALLSLREALSAMPAGLARDLALMAAAASVEPSSRLRRDGRALRYEPNKQPRNPLAEFQRRVAEMIYDIRTSSVSGVECHVHRGDGRRPKHIVGDREYDLILFSPPYPNNIDYTEVYKLEAWYLELFSSHAEFRQHRLTTVRSHPSVRFKDEYRYLAHPHRAEVQQLIEPLLAAVPEGRYSLGRRQIVQGYADDMFSVLLEARELVNAHGRLAFVVGNSVHGTADRSFVIAADILMSGLAELAGWSVDQIMIARSLRRRGVASPYLRESVVALRPA